MATIPSRRTDRRNDYPTSSSKPMPETDWHRDLMVLLIEMLRVHFAAQPRVYVSGNLLIFYEEGNRRRHVSPDVFVVRGVENYQRPNYLLWEEGRAPQIAIELTSSTTHRSDQGRKLRLYRDTLRVREYFLFDPLGDYLKPPLQGYRLRKGVYRRIRAVQERLPSQVLGLHLQREGRVLRLWNPAAGSWLPTPAERSQQEVLARQRAEEQRRQAEEQRQQAEEQRQQAVEERLQAEQRADAAERARQETERRAEGLAAELERLRQQLNPPPQE